MFELVKVIDGSPTEYSMGRFVRDYASEGFSRGNQPTDQELADRGIYRVGRAPLPDIDLAAFVLVSNSVPELVDGRWVHTWAVSPRDPAEALAAERAAMKCARQQGKLALGPAEWAKVVALADDPDTPWGLKVAVQDTVEWERTDEDMAALIWAMQLTEEQADDLFRLAMTL